MALTFARPPIQTLANFQGFKGTIIDITGDSSYPSGGYSISPSKVGFNKIYGAQLIGYSGAAAAILAGLQWDYANNKLIAVAAGGAGGAASLIVEETVTISSNAGRLTNAPAYIITAEATAGGTTGPLRIIPVGETPATTQMAVNFVTGAVALASADAVTAIKVSYIPLGVGPFIESNRVVDESNTGANDTTRQLANRASLIQYFWNDTAGTLPTLIPDGESPGSGEAAVDMDNSGNTIITVNAAQDDATYKITYWKFSGIGLNYGWTDSADLTVTSNALVFPAIDGIWIPGFGNILVGEATATNKQQTIVGPSGAAATDVAKYALPQQSLTFDAGDAITTISVPWMVLNASQIGGASGQIAAGTNLSTLIARMLFYGI